MEWGGTGREVMLSEQKDWNKINQKWASMLSHMSPLNIFSALVVWLLQYFITSRCSVLRLFFFVGNASNKQCHHHSILCQVNIFFFSYIHVELQQYEHSCSMDRPRATLGSSAVSYPPPRANTVRISLAWVLLPVLPHLSIYPTNKTKRSGYALKQHILSNRRQKNLLWNIFITQDRCSELILNILQHFLTVFDISHARFKRQWPVIKCQLDSTPRSWQK